MAEQYDIFGNCEEPPKPKPKIDKQKKNWENRFQRWSDKMNLSEPTETYGKCGYGSMCDYCENNSYGRPCVRALNEMCRVKNIKIDYSKRTYEEVWEGSFKWLKRKNGSILENVASVERDTNSPK